jgi:hypothetical protein
MAGLPDKRVCFHRQVLVYSAIPSRLFFNRRMKQANDFDFCSTLPSSLKMTKPPPEVTKSKRIDREASARLFVAGIIGYCVMAYFERLVAPVGCCLSFRSEFRPIQAALKESEPLAGKSVIVVGLILVSLNLLSPL